MKRLFVGIYPPLEITRAALALLGAVDLPKHRRALDVQTHLTVMFLGEKRDGDLDDVIAKVGAACTGIDPFRIRPVLLTALPERGPKRTVVVECDRPAGLLELHDRLVRRFARDPRPRDKYLPHVTVARFGGSGSPLTLKTPVSLGDFPVSELRLMESVLKPEGAEHREVARFGLGS